MTQVRPVTRSNAQLWISDLLRTWIRLGFYALDALYAPDLHCFYRNSTARDDGAPEGTGSLSSNRALIALVDYLHFIDERARDDRRVAGSPRARARDILSDLAENYYGHTSPRFRSHKPRFRSMLTDALAVTGMAAILSRTDLFGKEEPAWVERVRANQKAVVINLVKKLRKYKGGRVDDKASNHPIVTLHTIRAIDLAAMSWDPSTSTEGASKETARAIEFLNAMATDESRRRKFERRPRIPVLDEVFASIRRDAREAVIRQLGLHSARDAEFDPGGLLASLCTMQRFGGRSGRQLLIRGVEVLADCQDADGSWRADMVAGEEGQLVYLSSLEMAMLLANIVIADLDTGPSELVAPVSAILTRTFALLESGFIDLPGEDTDKTDGLRRGWGNDRVSQSRVVETWVTAIALQLLLRMDRISQKVVQSTILEELGATFVGFTASRWPDLDPVVIDPEATGEALDARLGAALAKVSDPSANRGLTIGIVDDVVRPILQSRFKRPGPVASFLLYGPPGTRKTSLLRELARVLRWPLVTIAPPHFLTEGIEGLERRADALFRDLTQLKRVVVLFDECEELFRRRTSTSTPDNRTHGAFITSGMLPRLQELRDRNWIVFAIVTNTELDELDPAVVRGGRLDQRARVGHPELDSQLAHVDRRLRDEQWEGARPDLKNALAKHDETIARHREEIAAKTLVAKTARDESGDLQSYSDAVPKLRVIEATQPTVTFYVLDRVIDRIKADVELPTAPAVVLRDYLSGAATREWGQPTD